MLKSGVPQGSILCPDGTPELNLVEKLSYILEQINYLMDVYFEYFINWN